MGYWGWRPLVCGMFISTWVVGCTIVAGTSSPTETPSPYPQITLTAGRIPNPTAPPQPPSQSPITVTPNTTAEITPALIVEPPTCYEQRGGDLLCLGRVQNTTSFSVSAAALEVVLSGSSGDTSVIAVIEQQSIPPGAFAPYGAVFAAEEAQGRNLVYARLLHAQQDRSPAALSLAVSEISGAPTGTAGRYLVSAQVANAFDFPILLTAAIITLKDEQQRVIAYRVRRFDLSSASRLEPGGSTLLRIDLFPEASFETADITVYVEGQRAEP